MRRILHPLFFREEISNLLHAGLVDSLKKKLLCRKRNHYAALSRQFLNAVLDVALDLWVEARLASPNQQSKIQGVLDKPHELNFSWRIVQHKIDALNGLEQCLGHEIHVGIVSHS